MRIESIEARPLDIAFRAQFSHAAAQRSATQTLWVEACDRLGRVGCGESCPREYVTGETLAGARAFVVDHASLLARAIVNAETLSDWVSAHRAQLDRNPAAWAAVEMALLDLIGRCEGRSVDELLDLPPLSGHFRYSAVIGDGSHERFEAELNRYLQAGFQDFKIKLSGDRHRDTAKVHALRAAGAAIKRVRADANNLWSHADQAIEALTALDFPFVALEEPLRANDYDGMARVAQALDCAIVLDESLMRWDQIDVLSRWPVRWIVNVRVSKMGGVLRSLVMVEAIRAAGLRMVMGAHVGETSLLTRAALTIANAARDVLVAQEGAFGTYLLERDVIDPPIMFGAGGMLDASALPQGAGWGGGAWQLRR